MIPYNKMYAILCAAVSEALDDLLADKPTAAALKLQAALNTTEEPHGESEE